MPWGHHTGRPHPHKGSHVHHKFHHRRTLHKRAAVHSIHHTNQLGHPHPHKGWHGHHAPQRRAGYIKAEDGSWVNPHFYG